MSCCGGAGDVTAADPEVQALCDSVKATAEEKTKRSFDEFTPVHFRRQVVAGTNYFIKVKVHKDGDHVHLRVFKPLPHTGLEASLHSIQENKTEGDVLEYF